MPRSQILLRLASVALLDSDGEQIEFAIKRLLSVNEPSRVHGGGFASSAFPGAFELQQLQAELRSQRDDIKRIDSNGFSIVSALDKRVGRIEGEVTKLKGTVVDLRRDIGGVLKELGCLKADLSEARRPAEENTASVTLQDQLTSLSSSLGVVEQQVATVNAQLRSDIPELRSQLSRNQQDMENSRAEIRDSVPAADHAQDVAVLRAEMSQLRRELEDVRARRMDRAETAFPPRELEILTSNIAKIGNRASQVETLQMELEILKGRVERTEASKQAPDARRPTHAFDSGDLPAYSDPLPGIRKRASSPGLDSVSKRHASSSGYSDFPERGYATPPAWPANPSISVSQQDSLAIANSGKRGRKPASGKSTSNGISARLRKR